MKKSLLLSLTLFYSIISFSQTDLIISEYVEGWSTNKALEIYNPTDAAINLSGYRITRYSNGSDIPPASDNWFIALPDYNLAPYRSYVVVLDKRDPNGEGQEAPVWEQLQQRADVFLCPVYSVSKAMYFNGNDGVALEKTDGTMIDLFARFGPPAPAAAALPGGKTADAWTNEYPYFTGTGKAITADHTLIRKSDINTGVTVNPDVFNPLAEYDSLPANTFEYLGWHKFDGAPANATPEFPIYSYEYIVTEQAAAGTVVGTPTATDAEEDKLTYYINSGNFVYINDNRLIPFEMDAVSGEIRVIDPNALIIAERDTFYLKISAHDGYSQTPQATVMVRVSNETIVDITSITIEAEGGADIINTAGGSLQFTASISPANASIQSVYWSVKDGTGSADIDWNGLLTAVSDGTVTVKAISKDGSGIESGEIQITISGQVGIFNHYGNSDIKIYPNPVSGNMITVSSSVNISAISISDINGRLMYKITNTRSSDEMNLSLPSLNKGIYIMKISHEDHTDIYKKIILNQSR